MTSGSVNKNKPKTEKRRYNSAVRQQQSIKTRELIITSGIELVQEFTTWDWKNLTFRAVATRAAISERTVYRHFSNEQALKDAIVQQLAKESGLNLDTLTLSEFSTTIKNLFLYMQSFSAKTQEIEDPSFSRVDSERRAALQRAVIRETPDWTEEQHKIVTATLDIFWQPTTYERLLNGWNFDSKQSLATLTWLIDLIEDAIKNNNPPDTK